MQMIGVPHSVIQASNELVQASNELFRKHPAFCNFYS